MIKHVLIEIEVEDGLSNEDVEDLVEEILEETTLDVKKLVVGEDGYMEN